MTTPGGADGTAEPAKQQLPTWLTRSLGLMVGALALMWLVEAIDLVFLDEDLDQQGIRPRTIGGLDGVLWAPFLHGGIGHLISNTIPFVILSALVMTRGWQRWLTGSAVIIVGSGLLVWAFAIGSNEVHIGASGWVFGLFGLLVAGAWFDRTPGAIVLALIALALYGTTVLFGLLPDQGVSWEGHVFGVVAGVLAAWLLRRRRPRSNEITDGATSGTEPFI